MNPEELLNDLIRTTNISVLQGICFRLQVDYEKLTGLTLNSKARALVDYLGQNGRLSELAAEISQLQPQLADKYSRSKQRRNWIDDIAAGENPLEDTMITMQWQDLPDEAPSDPWIHERTTITRRQANEAITANLNPLETNLTNPYEPTRPTYQAERFFGRESEQKRLWENIKNSQSMMIVGPSKIGKSSLLYMLTRPDQATPPYVTAYLDLQVRRYADLPEMLNAAFGQWVHQIGATDRMPHLDGMRDFSRWVKALNQKELKPVLCLDGIEALFKEPLALSKKDFGRWQTLAEENQLTFLFASIRPFTTLLQINKLETGFPTVFQRLDLGLLEATAVRDMLEKPMEQANLALPAGLIEQLYQLCGPHPFYLQIAGYHLFAGLAKQQYSWATVREAFINQATPHWETLWEMLSVAQQETLRNLCHSEAATKLSPRSVRVLARKGLALQAGLDQAYRPFSAGFAEWVRQHYPIQDKGETAVSPTKTSINLKERNWLDRLLRR